MPKTVTFNVRLVPQDHAAYMTRLAHSIGIPRERYIRKMFELHVAAERARQRTPGQYVLDVPTHEQISASIAADQMGA